LFLFIFESIGTSELLLIGVIALIFLGPRKLPEIARKIGKIMAEFRSTTQEFKSTWEREVNLEAEAKAFDLDLIEEERADRQAGELSSATSEVENSIGAPQVKEIDPNSFEQFVSQNEPQEDAAAEAPADEADLLSNKRTWL
jgi:sec-independent protein translocase protein TatB